MSLFSLVRLFNSYPILAEILANMNGIRKQSLMNCIKILGIEVAKKDANFLTFDISEFKTIEGKFWRYMKWVQRFLTKTYSQFIKSHIAVRNRSIIQSGFLQANSMIAVSFLNCVKTFPNSWNIRPREFMQIKHIGLEIFLNSRLNVHLFRYNNLGRIDSFFKK